MRADRKRGKVKVGRMNSIVTGIDLGDRKSLATVLSPVGDVADRFSFLEFEEPVDQSLLRANSNTLYSWTVRFQQPPARDRNSNER